MDRGQLSVSVCTERQALNASRALRPFVSAALVAGAPWLAERIESLGCASAALEEFANASLVAPPDGALRWDRRNLGQFEEASQNRAGARTQG